MSYHRQQHSHSMLNQVICAVKLTVNRFCSTKAFIYSQIESNQSCSNCLFNHNSITALQSQSITQTSLDRLKTFFAKSIHRILKIKIFNCTLSEQFEKLRKINILPLAYRQFFRLSTFIFNTLKVHNTPLAMAILNKKKISHTHKSKYTLNIYKKNLLTIFFFNNFN